MKMKGLIIGIGAAGNKAVINAIEKGVIDLEDCMLINSTLNDVPAKYKDNAFILGVNTGGGCGKERTKSKDAILEDLRAGRIPVKQKIENARNHIPSLQSCLLQRVALVLVQQQCLLIMHRV